MARRERPDRGGRQARRPAVLQGVAVLAAVLVGATAALLGVRALRADDEPVAGRPQEPAVDLPLTNADAAIATSRLNPVEPRSLFDNRDERPLPPGAEVDVSLLDVPEESIGVVLAFSTLRAEAPGDVTVTSSAGPITALKVAAKGGQTSTTLIVPIAGDGALRIDTAAGGHLLVQIVATVVPSGESGPGRVVPLPANEVFRLVKSADGDEKVLDLATVPALKGVSMSAILLQLSADVGSKGGFVRAGEGGIQELFWGATKGDDRTRGGLMLVPVDDNRITIHYEAGTELRADLLGYVTGEQAPASTEGLIVMVPREKRAGGATPVPPGETDAIDLVPAAGLAGVPPERIGGAFVRVTAAGDGIGGVEIRGVATERRQDNPTMLAANGVTRNVLTLVPVADGLVSAHSEAGAALTLAPEALILAE